MKSILISGLLLVSSVGFAQNWQALGSGIISGSPNTFLEWNNRMYLGGIWPSIGNIQSACVASFDGQYWDSLSQGLAGEVYTLAVYNNELYAGGLFITPMPYPPYQFDCAHLVKWNGTNWVPVVAGGVEDNVRDMAVFNGELYIGGEFLDVGGIPKYKIARFNGSAWSDVGGGFPGNCNVMCMEVFNGELYVGGHLILPGGPNNYYYNCVKWNGTQWDSVGGQWGPNWVNHFSKDTINNVLYIGGGVSYVDTIAFWEVAKYDGTSITSTGRCPAFGILAMSMFQNELYVGGSGFGDTVLAKYDGNTWVPVEINPNGGVNGLGVYQGNLYVGGGFSQIGNIQANNIACYGFTCPTNVGINENHSENTGINVFPSPGTGEIFIKMNGNYSGRLRLELHDSFGRKVLEKEFEKETSFLSHEYPPGAYLVLISEKTSGKLFGKKLLIE